MWKNSYDKINDSKMTIGTWNVNRKWNLLDECVFIYYTTYYKNKTFYSVHKKHRHPENDRLSSEWHLQNYIWFYLSKYGKWKTWNAYTVDEFDMFKTSTVSGSSFGPSLSAFDVHSHQIAVTGCLFMDRFDSILIIRHSHTIGIYI